MIGYRREIDGLRALAVVPVILFHAGFEIFSGGFVGVDVFFVISGYLITSIIITEKEAGIFSLATFWERRARRILPVLFLVITVCVPASFVLLDQYSLYSFAKSTLAASMFFSNFHFWKDVGYFETAAELKPLLHTWSLAVEEQYYILFPLFMLAIWRFGNRWMIAIHALLALSSFYLSVWASTNMPSAAFFMLPMRGWELVLGAFVSLYCVKNRREEPPRWIGNILSTLGLLLICFASLTFSSATPFPGFHALIPTLGAVLIILFANQNNYVGQLLSSRAMVSIGLISYSAYLWHQPIFAFLRHLSGDLTHLSLGLSTAVVFLISYFSWKYVEQPFRNKQQTPKTYFIKIVLIVGICLVLTALAGIRFFSSKAHTGTEATLAEALAGSSYVYANNMDERIFIKNRIVSETLNPDTIIIGSSRIMQVGAHIYNKRPLNLAVSGASVEDHIAISGLAFENFKPTTLLIGADPWLFNSESGLKRWRSVEAEYQAFFTEITGAGKIYTNNNPNKTDRSTGGASFYDFYRSINLSYRTYPEHDYPEARAKIRSDGSRIYGIAYATRGPELILRGIEQALNYAMKRYTYDADLRSKFESLISYYKRRTDVVLVLSPYHPALYEKMVSHRRVFLEVEDIYVDIGKKLGIRVVGSYNPAAVGCIATEFYDGSHPKDSCMEKVLRPLAN
jgi:peptidoglycan/LPS O-acetylase OafA/YrhL